MTVYLVLHGAVALQRMWYQAAEGAAGDDGLRRRLRASARRRRQGSHGHAQGRHGRISTSPEGEEGEENRRGPVAAVQETVQGGPGSRPRRRSSCRRSQGRRRPAHRRGCRRQRSEQQGPCRRHWSHQLEQESRSPIFRCLLQLPVIAGLAGAAGRGHGRRHVAHDAVLRACPELMIYRSVYKARLTSTVGLLQSLASAFDC